MNWCPEPFVLPCSSIQPTLMTTESTLRDVKAAARAMGLQIQVHNVSTSREIDAVFESFGRTRPDALFVAASAFFQPARPTGPPGDAPQAPRDTSGA